MRWIQLALTAGVLALAQVALVAEGKPPVKPSNKSNSNNSKGKTPPKHPNGKPPSGPKPTPEPTKKPGPGNKGKTPGPGTTGKAPTPKAAASTAGKKGRTTWEYIKRGNKKTSPKSKPTDKFAYRELSNNKNVTPAEKAALGKVMSGRSLTDSERATLAPLAKGRDGVSRDQSDAVGRALDDDLDRRSVSLSRRYLRLQNDTGERLTVFVVYMTLDRRNQWHWVPGQPPSSQVVRLELPPGSARQARNGSEDILACRARVWASSGGNSWHEWKDRDLLLVPERDENGGHRYFAPNHDTFTFRFHKK